MQVRPRWDQSHQVQVRPRYIREYPGPNDAQGRTRVNRSREAQIWIRVIVFQVRPNGDHRKEFQESPIREAEPSDPGEFQVGPQSKVQVRRRWQQDSPSPGEAQVATSHHIQVQTS